MNLLRMMYRTIKCILILIFVCERLFLSAFLYAHIHILQAFTLPELNMHYLNICLISPRPAERHAGCSCVTASVDDILFEHTIG